MKSMMNPIYENIENQLKKLFVNLNSEKWVKVSSILSRLDISFISNEIEQRVSNYSVDSMLKLYLHKRVKGIRSYPKLSQDLEKNDNLQNLGFNNLPTKQNFNHFIKTKLNQSILNDLHLIAETILSTATKEGYVLDLDIVEKKVRDYKNKAREERKVVNESSKLIKKLIYPKIKLDIGKNSRFTTKDLLDILVHVSQTHDFAHNGCKSFNDLYEDKDVPHGRTFLYHLKKLEFKEDVEEVFEKITDFILQFAKKNYNVFNKRHLNIAYDIHKIPFYGKKADYIKSSKSERGTCNFYQFLTCDIVNNEKRFTIDVIPIHALDNVDDLLDVSLQRVKKKIRIDKVFLDRGFANSGCVKALKKNNMRYLMPMSRNNKVKQWMDKSSGCVARVVEDFEIKKEKTNLYLVDDPDGIKRCFITNLRVPVLISHYLYKWYGLRWGIETGYRLKAQDFKPRTTSKNFTLRLFYFLFSVMLYNLWVLTNIVVGIKLYGKSPKKPIITAKRFSIILYKVQEDSGG